jgi:hypothetical protein
MTITETINELNKIEKNMNEDNIALIEHAQKITEEGKSLEMEENNKLEQIKKEIAALKIQKVHRGRKSRAEVQENEEAAAKAKRIEENKKTTEAFRQRLKKMEEDAIAKKAAKKWKEKVEDKKSMEDAADDAIRTQTQGGGKRRSKRKRKRKRRKTRKGKRTKRRRKIRRKKTKKR